MGNLSRAKQWFDSAGALRSLDHHYPYNDTDARGHLSWDTPTAQQVLDVALAFAVINRHFASAPHRTIEARRIGATRAWGPPAPARE